MPGEKRRELEAPVPPDGAVTSDDGQPNLPGGANTEPPGGGQRDYFA